MSGSFEQAFKSQLSSWRNSINLSSSSSSSGGGLFSSFTSNNNNSQVSTNSSPSIFSKISSLNPFGSNNSYIALPVTERDGNILATPNSNTVTTTSNIPTSSNAEQVVVEEPAWFTLSYWDRLLIFGICLVASCVCFLLCFFIFPVLALKPRKFALLWSLGSLLFILSFGVLQGPLNYLYHLISPHRLPFTCAYFGAIIATLVFALSLKSTLLTIPACLVQVVAALWYAISYFPMGTQSLKFASRIGARQVNNWINS